MDMSERNGGNLWRVLESAESFSDFAIFFGSFQVNTPGSSLRAKFSRVTLVDQLPELFAR